MATVFESSFLSSRIHHIEDRYEEPPNIFGKCDCTSYNYLALSVALFIIGTTITIFALGDVADGHILSNLGQMWFIGPMFICSGLMVAVKCMLYLRRKSVIEMIIQRQLIMHFQELTGTRGMVSMNTATPQGPPSYEVIMQDISNELPPPSYTEAIALLERTIENDGKSSAATVSCDITPDENVRHKP